MIKHHIRTIPDHPKKGVLFRDITTLLKDPTGFRAAVDSLVTHYRDQRVHKVVGIEARGFILGAPVAYLLGVGFVPVRKKGKLPAPTLGHDYELEYGTDRVEVHVDAIGRGERVLIIDDLLATGGTAEAAATLVERAGGQIVGCGFVIDLPELGGHKRLEARRWPVFALCEFEGD
jgi:adenine phosphoribosyltransferase